jgi:hypothetical protein
VDDDIVTRLRDVICCCADGYLQDDCDACKAANEIERLQATITELRAEVQRLEQVARG